MYGMSDDPLCLALELTRTHNHKLYQYITNLSHSCEDFGKCDAALRGKIRNSQRTKFVTYRTINPKCAPHQVYSRDPHFMTLIPEYLRIAFTRMRLSSHRLRIETGTGLGSHVNTAFAAVVPYSMSNMCYWTVLWCNISETAIKNKLCILIFCKAPVNSKILNIFMILCHITSEL